jgi:hypothetical protein
MSKLIRSKAKMIEDADCAVQFIRVQDPNYADKIGANQLILILKAIGNKIKDDTVDCILYIEEYHIIIRLHQLRTIVKSLVFPKAEILQMNFDYTL